MRNADCGMKNERKKRCRLPALRMGNMESRRMNRVPSKSIVFRPFYIWNLYSSVLLWCKTLKFFKIFP